MTSILKGKPIIHVVLFLGIFTFVLAGCGGSKTNGNGGGNGGDEPPIPGEVRLADYVGTWQSTGKVNPVVEFTIEEIIDSVEGKFGDVPYTNHYFKGKVKCSVLTSGEISIEDIPDDDDGKPDHIYVQELADTMLLYLEAGFDDDLVDGTVEITHGYIDENGDLVTLFVEITDKDGTTLYETSLFDKFTKR